MMITDQISSFVPSPLIGENVSELGDRFPDMTHIYDEELQGVDRRGRRGRKISRCRKAFISRPQGPNFESPAEIRMYSLLGADAVGMSTACEAIAARHAGVACAGFPAYQTWPAGSRKKN